MRIVYLCSVLAFGFGVAACGDDSPEDNDSNPSESTDSNDDDSASQSDEEEEIDTEVQATCAEACVNQSLCIANFFIVWKTIDNCVDACMRNPDEPLMACSASCEMGVTCDTWTLCTADCADLI